MTSIGQYLTFIFDVFGLIDTNSNDIGFHLSSSTVTASTGGLINEGRSENANSHGGLEKILTPYLDILTKFRETVRLAAISGQYFLFCICIHD